MAEGRSDTRGLIDPVIQWPVGEASQSGLAYFGGSLWAACLGGQRLYRIPVGADGSVADPAPLFVGQYGRLRTIVAAADGALWFTTSNRDGRGRTRDVDDQILQFRP
jgi:glucose/arabinose dehydrogenase